MSDPEQNTFTPHPSSSGNNNWDMPPGFWCPNCHCTPSTSTAPQSSRKRPRYDDPDVVEVIEIDDSDKAPKRRRKDSLNRLSSQVERPVETICISDSSESDTNDSSSLTIEIIAEPPIHQNPENTRTNGPLSLSSLTIEFTREPSQNPENTRTVAQPVLCINSTQGTPVDASMIIEPPADLPPKPPAPPPNSPSNNRSESYSNSGQISSHDSPPLSSNNFSEYVESPASLQPKSPALPPQSPSNDGSESYSNSGQKSSDDSLPLSSNNFSEYVESPANIQPKSPALPPQSPSNNGSESHSNSGRISPDDLLPVNSNSYPPSVESSADSQPESPASVVARPLERIFYSDDEYSNGVLLKVLQYSPQSSPSRRLPRSPINSLRSPTNSSGSRSNSGSCTPKFSSNSSRSRSRSGSPTNSSRSRSNSGSYRAKFSSNSSRSRSGSRTNSSRSRLNSGSSRPTSHSESPTNSSRSRSRSGSRTNSSRSRSRSGLRTDSSRSRLNSGSSRPNSHSESPTNSSRSRSRSGSRTNSSRSRSRSGSRTNSSRSRSNSGSSSPKSQAESSTNSSRSRSRSPTNSSGSRSGSGSSTPEYQESPDSPEEGLPDPLSQYSNSSSHNPPSLDPPPFLGFHFSVDIVRRWCDGCGRFCVKACNDGEYEIFRSNLLEDTDELIMEGSMLNRVCTISASEYIINNSTFPTDERDYDYEQYFESEDHGSPLRIQEIEYVQEEEEENETFEGDVEMPLSP